MASFHASAIFCSILIFSQGAQHFRAIVEDVILPGSNNRWSVDADSLLECAILCEMEKANGCIGFGYQSNQDQNCILRKMETGVSWTVTTEGSENVGSQVYQAQNAITANTVVVYQPKEGRYVIPGLTTAIANCTFIGKTIADPADLQANYDNSIQICTYCWASDGKLYYIVSIGGTYCGHKNFREAHDQDVGNVCCKV